MKNLAHFFYKSYGFRRFLKRFCVTLTLLVALFGVAFREAKVSSAHAQTPQAQSSQTPFSPRILAPHTLAPHTLAPHTLAPWNAFEPRIEKLLNRMTLEEKVGQLNLYGRGDVIPYDAITAGTIGSAMNVVEPDEIVAMQKAARQSRLKIPLLFGLDAVQGFRTIFPQPLGQAATWNPERVEEAARWTGYETFITGITWTFAPMIDFSRDPRWGRVMEGAGEDPYLASIIASARVRGYQQGGVAATAKHFVGYGAAEAGRDYNSTWIPNAQLHDMHLPPFKAALDSGVMTVMAAFNALNSVPATAHTPLLTGLLKQKWGFEGFVVSDFASIAELKAHGIANDDREAARKAFLAGVDMDMFSGLYAKYIGEEVRARRIPVARLNDAVRRILRVKFRLGLFDTPDLDPHEATQKLDNPLAREAARRVARESLILLKNDGVLPLSPSQKSHKTIAVIGAFATHDEGKPWTSPHRLPPPQVQTLPHALGEILGTDVNITFAKGTSDTCGQTFEARQDAIAQAQKADVIIAMLGEDCEYLGEAASRTQLNLPGVQQELLEALVATGKPVVLVLVTGRPLVLTWAEKNVSAIVQTFHAGVEARPAIAEVLTGRTNPSGKTPMSFPRSVGQIPVYYNHLPTGRPPLRSDRYTSIYMDELNEPLFPFGFGLSYTRFRYDNVRLNRPYAFLEQTIVATVTLTNTGEHEGQEVAQLYIRQAKGTQSHPVRELKGFQKIALKAGESREVTFELSVKSLGFHDDQGQYQYDEGSVEVFIGGSSLATERATFELKKRP
jgi:beta-glucosidase